jgi:adenosine/AMP kinase
MELKIVEMIIPEESNIIVGQSHFIKTVEVRVEGNDEELKNIAADNAMKLSCGHSFNIVLKGAYPINVLNQLKSVPEVCRIIAATANPLQVIVAETEQGRGIMGVIDGAKSKGIEDEEGIKWRKDFLRMIGYKT